MSNELINFLVSQGHSDERAKQIAENHPDAVRADMEKASGTPQEPEVVPDLASLEGYLDHAFKEITDRVEALEGRHERLIDHVNREIGVAGDPPLVERIRALEGTFVAGAVAAKQKGANDGEEKKADSTPEEERAVPQT